MKKNVFYLMALCSVFFLSILMLFSNCKGDTGGGQDKPGGQDTTSVINDTVKEEMSINNVSIWIDESASMKGYFMSANERNITTVIAAINSVGECDGVSFYGQSLGQTIKYDEFKKKVENGNPLSGKESNLKSMIETAVNKTTAGSLIFIVTDGIMSGSDKQIDSSPKKRYNIIHRGDLTQEIKNVLNPHTDDISISVAQYSSYFKGTYSCYNNSKKSINEKLRPFYLIVVGKKEKVSLYEKEKMNGKLKSENFVTYGIKGMPFELKMRPYPSDFFELKKGKYSMSGKYNENRESDITFRIPISSLPKYMQSEAYIKANGHLQSKSGNQSDDHYKDVEVTDMTISNKVVSYTIDRNKLKGNTFRYKLDYVDPTWVKDSSTDDDINNYSDATTFNFVYFMEGLSVLNGQETVNVVEKSIINF